MIAAVCALVPLAGNVVATFVTSSTGLAGWLVVPAVAVLVGIANALIQAAHPPPDVSHRRIPLAAALAVVLLMTGAGGWGVAVGVRYAAGFITGNEGGDDRLVRPAAGSGSGVSLTVQEVTDTEHFTRVGLQARNQARVSVSLPLFQNCVLTGEDGTTLQADSFRSRWTTTIPPGGLQRGTITFPGHLPGAVTLASFSFSQVFGPLGAGAITVHGIRLRPP